MDKLNCNYCGDTRPDVEEVVNPFVADVCNEEVIEPLCTPCYRTLSEEI